MISRRFAWTVGVLLLAAALAFAALATWKGRLEIEPPGPPLASDEPDRLDLSPVTFADLPGWRDDAVADALPALLRSCRRLAGLPAETPLGGEGFAGTAGDWRAACAEAARLPPGDDAAARAFFERAFQPLAATNHGAPIGLFTGYYEPLLRGSRRRHGPYRTPLYRRPAELVTVDLGDFRESLKGQRVAGRVEGRALVPYADREEIAAGALARRGLELVWVDDPVDAFFLEIQGSGRIELAEGGVLRLGYAAQNGHPYTAIGRELVKRSALEREEVSMQSIRRWLEEHPAEAGEILETNASYVFFQELKGEGPLGAEGLPLTPGRSLAVDRAYYPLGLPVWLAARAPDPRPGAPDRPLHRLLVAQDTGGAITGPVRGDLFWGHGEEAAEIAGRMRHPGRLWVLLPKPLAASVN